jgi:hypothetical protein
MRRHSVPRLTAGILLAAAALLGPMSASAQSQKAGGSDDWKFRASAYLWLPSIDVTSNFPPPLGWVAGGNTKVDGGDFLDSIDSVFMGTFEARKGRWGGVVDYINLNLGKTKSGNRSFTVGGSQITVPVNAALTGDYSLDGDMWTVAGQYAAIDEPTHNLNVLAGARYLTLDQKFTWAFSGNIGSIALPLRSGTVTSDGSVTDFIIGVRGQAKLGDGRWFVPYHADVGFGQSNSSYQALVGIGYAFDWGDVTASYRALGYDLSDSKFVSDLRLHGGQVGIGFRW